MLFRLFQKCLFALFIIVLFLPKANAETQDQHLEVVLRSIGHEFLLQLDDSTSRILPIEKIDGRYSMQFETAFSYEPDILTSAALKVLEAYTIQESFIVEVEKCDTNEVVHSFEVGLKKDDNIIPCAGRVLPLGCYKFYFTVVENKASIQPAGQPDSSRFNYMYAVLILIAAALLVVYLIKRKKSSKSRSEFINIGKYQFDKKGMVLLLKAQSTELSSKESDLLYLLASNENKTLEREYILNVVWGDEGDYVGRTLDVFVSKLRKKLEADSNIKIINIRGVGYRFVIN